MRGLEAVRSAAVAALLVFLAAAVPAAGQSSEEKLRELERKVEELSAEVARARQAAPAPDTAELERRIELLAAELEKLELGEATVEADKSAWGLGPAASKVYQKSRGVSIGGYGELLYQNFDSTRDDGAASSSTDQLDLLRAVLYFGYKWNDLWLFNSELEWEHADVEEGGDAAVEFAYVDRMIRPEINVRAGLLLVPVGLINELHEPTVFLGARRPAVETAILPSTWRENGVGVFGDLGPITYKSYIVNGLDAGEFSARGIRSGRQKGAEAKAEDLAWVTRIDWTSVPGLVAGGSLYVGDAGQDLRDERGRGLGVATTLVEAHVDWKWRGLQLRGLAARTTIGEVAALDRSLGLTGAQSVGERQEGGYVEAGYDVMAHRGGAGALIPYLRWESYDTQARVPAGFARDPANDVEILTAGVAWKPFERIVVKADFQDVDNGAGTGVDQFNVALGYVF